jgi:hypothetical protein
MCVCADKHRYMDDLEVRTMMEQVAKRIKELELSTARDAADDKAAADRAAWKEKLSITSKPRGNQEDSDDDEVGGGAGWLAGEVVLTCGVCGWCGRTMRARRCRRMMRWPWPRRCWPTTGTT